MGPYRALGEKQGGRLVADHDWFPALDELIRNPRQRKRLARRALKWAKTQTIDHHAQAWENAFLDATERVQQRNDVPMRPAAAAR